MKITLSKVGDVILSLLIGVPFGGVAGAGISLMFIVAWCIPIEVFDIEWSFLELLPSVICKVTCGLGMLCGPIYMYEEVFSKESK